MSLVVLDALLAATVTPDLAVDHGNALVHIPAHLSPYLLLLGFASCIASSNSLSRRQRAGRRWHDRVFQCACDHESPSPACRVHRLMRACEHYIAVLDLDWYRLVPCHNQPPPNLSAVDAATLYRDIGLEPRPQ
jgi:hypothetical protein